MITREEAIGNKPFIQAECEKCDYVDLYYNDSAYKVIINKIYDEFEQHIKSLEAQLANTEQLTCGICDNWIKGNGNFGDCSLNVSNIPRCEGMTTHDFYCKFHDKKDTQ